MRAWQARSRRDRFEDVWVEEDEAVEPKETEDAESETSQKLNDVPELELDEQELDRKWFANADLDLVVGTVGTVKGDVLGKRG